MKKVLIVAAFAAALPCAVHAQVEKQVEVTKAYVPRVESASKLAVIPDMTDTVKMRPDIDYSITPLSLETNLATRPIRPATVTYWEFNRPRPFYIKAGMGYPLNSVFDFYAATQNPGTGYALGYVNHEGRYADIRNYFGEKNNSVRMLNRIGAAAGKYFGKHILEGGFAYENRLYHRYGSFYAPEYEPLAPVGGKVNYDEFDLNFRFGDDFKDLSRVNFEVALDGVLFRDHSPYPDYRNRARQSNLGAHAKVARKFGRSMFLVQGGYKRLSGAKAIDGYSENIVQAGIRYGYDGNVVDFEVGADYYWDKISGSESDNYILPYARLDIDLGTKVLKPFVEVDGGLHDNSFRSLTRQNPYVISPVVYSEKDLYSKLRVAALDKSSAEYNVRFGLKGTIFREMLSYRLYAGFSIRDNRAYWFNLEPRSASDKGHETLEAAFYPAMGRQTVTSFNGELELRPASRFHAMLGVHGYIYNNESSHNRTSLCDGSPSFEGVVKAMYEGRKVSFGVTALLQSSRKWSSFGPSTENAQEDGYKDRPFVAPFAFDLRVHAAWKVSGRVTLFAEGRNLLNRRLYEYPWYPEYGANFTAGAVVNF